MASCPHPLASGPRKGQPCAAAIAEGDERCGRHRGDSHPRQKRDEAQAAFLAAFATAGNITAAADLTGTNRASHYDWMRDDPTYEDRFRQARREAIDTLRAAAWSRAVDGVDHPVLNNKGEVVDTVAKYSDVLLIFLMKAAAPDEFRDNYSVKVEGQVTHTHVMDWEGTEANMLDAARKRREAIEAESVERTTG